MFGFLKSLFEAPVTYHAVFYSPGYGDDDEAWGVARGPGFDTAVGAKLWHYFHEQSDLSIGSFIGIIDNKGNWVDSY